MRIFFITILIIITYLNSKGQEQFKLDSLWRVYNLAKHDTIRIRIINQEIGPLAESQRLDSAIICYKLAVSIADKALNNPKFSFHLKTEVLKRQKATSLSKIGTVYLDYGSYDKAIEFYLQASKIFAELNDKNGISTCYFNIGNVHSDHVLYSKAIEYYLKALKIKEELHDKKGMSICYYNIGNVRFDQGLYDKAVENYLKALKLFEELEDKKGMSYCYNCIGLVYWNQNLYDKAIEYYLKSLKISEELDDKSGIAGCYTNIGLVHYNQGLFDKAIEYHLKGLKIFNEINDKKGMAECYTNIGNILHEREQYGKAIEYYLKSLKISEELEDKNGIATVNIDIASLHIVLSDSLKQLKLTERTAHLDSAIIFGKKAYDLALEIGAVPIQNNAAKYLQDAYTKLGRFKDAITYAKIFIATNDSMFKVEKTNALAEMNTKYETEKKELEIEKMVKQKELDNKTIEAQQLENKKQFIIIIASVIGFIVVLIFSIILLRMFRQKRKDNILLYQQKEEIISQKDEIESQRDEISAQRDLVTEQKEHIEEIHKDLTDSINYAERIQRSFLATKEILSENLSDYFIFYQPKDVVSGDFYWASKLFNGNFALVTADSTGHGVPGAIMSILNISSLEKAVELKMCNPSEILNYTRKTIIERLKKDGSKEGGKDGMDASLICIDNSRQKFTYSAANNPIWIIRDNHIIELNPDKMPVGKHDKDQIPFTQNEFLLQKGDTIYTLTDGLPDQFGGKNGKKFKYAPLKALLISICSKPMEDQKQILENTLKEWKGNLEQVDDITLLGMRI